MSSMLFYILIICGISSTYIGFVFGESQICGYVGDSILCCSGYTKDEQGECTIPVCENECGPGGYCIRPGMCYCASGRVGPSCPEDGRQDSDVNARQRAGVSDACPGNCNEHGVCVRSTCECFRGFDGLSCEERLVDKCYLSLSRGICQKSNNDLRLTMELCCGAFDVAWGDPCQKCPKSNCDKGFLSVEGACRDINECEINGLCRNGQCENLDGSYRCTCSPGYQFNPLKGDCVKNKDPCQQVPSVCGPGMKCVALRLGKYICPCISGYVKSPDEKSCVQKQQKFFDFCSVYGSYVCQYGKCQQDGNNYKCECNPGYRLSGDLKSCKKSIDYCSLYQNVLCPNGECVPVNDDYMCKCNPGYSPSFNRKKCTSVCDLYPGSLCPNAKCIPKQGGDYECQCNEGFSAIGKGKQCRRIMSDQSASSANLASTNDNQASYDVDYCSYEFYRKQCEGGKCYNRKGQYQCECLHGFISDKNGLACKKIDSPVSGQMQDVARSVDLKSYCDKYGSFLCTNGHCLESGSSYICRCNRGYRETSDGKSCYDIDECETDAQVCAQGTCTNSPGSYQCSCYDGFTIHYVTGGPKCYDRNECEEDRQLCSNGQCVNNWGSYSCSCNNGFIPSSDGKQCISVQSSGDSTYSLDRNECGNCVSACTRINSTYHQCQCPSRLAPVFNLGLCAPLNQVVDIQFDIPATNIRRQKRSVSERRNIFFELLPGVDRHKFADQVSSVYKDVVLDRCLLSKRLDKDGILCSYHSGSEGR